MRQDRLQNFDVILGADFVEQGNKQGIHSPADVLPILPRRTKLSWLGTLPAVGLGDTDGRDSCIYKRKDQISWCNLPHRLIEGIPPTIGVAFWRPQIAPGNLMAEGLILVDPPISHDESAPRSAGDFAVVVLVDWWERYTKIIANRCSG